MLSRKLFKFRISSTKKQPKHPNALQLPIFKTKLQQMLYIKPYALSIMQQLQLYIEEPLFKKKFKANYLNLKYTWICIHTWLILNQLKNKKSSLYDKINSFFIGRSMKMLLEEYTRDFVYQYSDNFNIQIYNELLRMRGTIFWALEDYFIYKHYQKPFQQIVSQDMGYENIQVELSSQQIEKYINKSIQLLSQYDSKELLQCQIKWQSNVI